jgi:hypothetical protein
LGIPGEEVMNGKGNVEFLSFNDKKDFRVEAKLWLKYRIKLRPGRW